MIFGPEMDDHMPENRQISQNFNKIVTFYSSLMSANWGGDLRLADSAEGAIMENMLT